MPRCAGWLCLLLLLAPPALRADEPGEVLVIRAGRVIPVAGPELSPGTVVIREGKIEAVGRRVAPPPGSRLLEVPELVVMPGLISPRSRFGLPRYRRSGNHAHLSAGGEVDPTRGRFAPPLRAGYLLLGLVPEGSGIPGAASVLRCGEADSAEGLLVEAPGYLRVAFSDLPGDKATFRDALEKARAAIQREEQARKAWEEKHKAQPAPAQPNVQPAQGGASAAPVASPQPAVAAPAFQPPPIAPELAPFVALLRGNDAPRLLIELGKASDMAHLEEVWARFKLKGRPAAWALEYSNWSDVHLLVEQLGNEKALVVCPPELALEPYTRTRRNVPQELTRAGARVALLPPGDDLPRMRRALEAAAVLVRDGLSREAALAGLTRWPAQLLGLEGSHGTLEAGRAADLILLDGDPLAPGTRVVRVLQAGQETWRRGADEESEEDGDAR